MDRACKSFEFSLSYSILNTPLPILFLPIMFLNPAPFPPVSPLLLPADNPANNLHIYDTVPVLVVYLDGFSFYFLDLIVDSCEFVVILIFIVLIFFFLNKCF